MRISDWSSDVCSSDLLDLSGRFGDQRCRAGLPQPVWLFLPGNDPGNYEIGNADQKSTADDAEEEAERLVDRTVSRLSHRLGDTAADRSEERRVGKEGVSTC